MLLNACMQAAVTFVALDRLLCLGRFLVGLGIGISAVVVPVYLGEVAPAQVSPACPIAIMSSSATCIPSWSSIHENT